MARGAGVAGTADPDDAAGVVPAPRSISGSGTVPACAGLGALDATAACTPAAGTASASAVAAVRATAPVAARASIPVCDLLRQATARGHTIRSFICPPGVGNGRVERPRGSLQAPRSAQLPARGRNTPFRAGPERGTNTHTYSAWAAAAIQGHGQDAGGQPAVDRQDYARDVRRCGRSEKGHRVGDVLGSSDPPQRDVAGQFLEDLRVAGQPA